MSGSVIKTEKSKNGNDIILIDGYEFMLNKHAGAKYYWCCVLKNSKQCRSHMTTELRNNEHILKKGMSEHSHAPNAGVQESIFLKNKLKRDAASSSDGPTKIIRNNLESVPSTSACCLPNKNALRQIIYRARKKTFPREPSTLEEINIPTEYTVEGEPFLARHTEYGENKCLLIFCTKQNIKLLRDSPLWIMDGTFCTCPGLFVQIYSIHGVVGNNAESRKILPLVYCFLVDKTEETYMVMFRELLSYAEELQCELQPQNILTDFETAVINVVKIFFPEATHTGCLFHLAQNLWRQIQKAGLASRYGNDCDFSLQLRHIVALAYLTPEEIPDAFAVIKEEVLPEEATPIIDWFETYYVQGRAKSFSKGTTVSIQRTPPLFPPQLWSIHRINQQGLPRTQNNVEAWHRRWNYLQNNNRHGLYATIRSLVKEQITTNHAVEKAQAGVDKTPPKKKSRRVSDSIARICSNRDDMELIPFLRAIANHIEL